ncbi:MAG TPA: SMI1/KNR4 family protein [Isosphaeraceae bacterium]|nr:SMI1/KNR4 family protein [Isosphaeraceae bacterium]
MRRLDEINDYPDIYQPVPDEDIEAVEEWLEFSFPESYRRFLRQPDIEAVKRLPSLLWFVRHDGVGILDANEFLRGKDYDPFPDRLIAFATNECGDFFCFDRDTGKIVYIDPEHTVEENLKSGELVYESFEKWMKQRLERSF